MEDNAEIFHPKAVKRLDRLLGVCISLSQTSNRYSEHSSMLRGIKDRKGVIRKICMDVDGQLAGKSQGAKKIIT